MTRVEENKNLIKEMYKRTNELPARCFEESVSLSISRQAAIETLQGRK